MKTLLLCLIAGVLSACATVAENPWQGLTVDTDPAVTSIDCGKFPLPTEVISNSIVYDTSGANDLEAYRVCSEANAGIADEHAAQIAELKTARKALVEAGQAQRNIATMKQEMLEDERQHHFWQSLGYWIMIGGLAAAL